MSGHLCVGCHREEAKLREKNGNRLRFCNEPCQTAFYGTMKSLRIGFGLLDELKDVATDDLHTRLEALFAPHKGDDLPGVLVTAIEYAAITDEDRPGLPVERVVEIMRAILSDTFLGMDDDVLLRAMFDYSLEHRESITITALIGFFGDRWELWGMQAKFSPYDGARVAYVFARIEALDLDVRQDLVRLMGKSQAAKYLSDTRVHFARQVIRLNAVTDVPEMAMAVLKSTPSPSLLHELIAISGEAGSRTFFGRLVDILQGEVATGQRHPQTDRTVVLAKALASENGWQ
jgi:hypothetical protein